MVKFRRLKFRLTIIDLYFVSIEVTKTVALVSAFITMKKDQIIFVQKFVSPVIVAM